MSLCCILVCVHIARNSWKKLPSCMNCMFLHLAADFMHIQLQVSSILYSAVACLLYSYNSLSSSVLFSSICSLVLWKYFLNSLSLSRILVLEFRHYACMASNSLFFLFNQTCFLLLPWLVRQIVAWQLLPSYWIKIFCWWNLIIICNITYLRNRKLQFCVEIFMDLLQGRGGAGEKPTVSLH